jgi:hypothetical protein
LNEVFGATPKTARETHALPFTRELGKLHPDNRHVKEKIRQQLQVLRDTGLLLHVVRLRFTSVFALLRRDMSTRQERGCWRLP